MLKHSHNVDTGHLLSGAEVDIPSKVTLGGLGEVQILEDYYLMDAFQDEEEELLEKSRYHDHDLGSFRQH